MPRTQDAELGWINDATRDTITSDQPRDFRDACGTFRVTAYAPSAVGSDSVPPYASTGKKCGATLAATFSPETFVRGDRIALLQIQRCLKTEKDSLVRVSYYTGLTLPHENGANDWYVDFGGDPCPFFGINLDSNGALGNTDNGSVGSRGGVWTPAKLHDRPSRTWNTGETIEHRFVTLAASYQAPPEYARALDLYLCGILTWGWSADVNGRVEVCPLGTLENLPDLVEAALHAWAKADTDLGRLKSYDSMPLPRRLPVNLHQFGWKAY